MLNPEPSASNPEIKTLKNTSANIPLTPKAYIQRKIHIIILIIIIIVLIIITIIVLIVIIKRGPLWDRTARGWRPARSPWLQSHGGPGRARESMFRARLGFIRVYYGLLRFLRVYQGFLAFIRVYSGLFGFLRVY